MTVRSDPFLRCPLDDGTPVAIDAVPADAMGHQHLEAVRALLNGSTDVVLVAVPEGEGVPLAHRLGELFGLSPELERKQP